MKNRMPGSPAHHPCTEKETRSGIWRYDARKTNQAFSPAERYATLPVGVSREEVALGERVFHGEVAGATCGGCHGSDAKGSPIGPDLTSGTWLWIAAG
jgi:mono/diheme cytochrome c family protein